MKIYIHIITILFIMFWGGATHLMSQVSIGSGKEPADFASLQIDGVEGGLRLPQLSTLQMGSLKTDLTSLSPVAKKNAAGLIVYNMGSNEIEYWDGEDWAVVGSGLQVKNGISKDLSTGAVELGGALTENTQINTGVNQLDFTSGKWTVNNTVFEIDGETVKIVPSSIDIKDNTVAITDAGKVSIEGELSIVSDHNSLIIDNGVVQIIGQLQYKEKNLGAGKVLTASHSGKAYWGDLRANNYRESIPIPKNDNPIPKSVEIVVSDGPLILTPGKWLIFAKVTARTTGWQRMHLWMKIRDASNPSATEMETLICSVGGDVDTEGVSIPQLTFFITVSEDTPYNLTVATSNTGMKLIQEARYGTPHFYAVLIDKPQAED